MCGALMLLQHACSRPLQRQHKTSCALLLVLQQGCFTVSAQECLQKGLTMQAPATPEPAAGAASEELQGPCRQDPAGRCMPPAAAATSWLVAPCPMVPRHQPHRAVAQLLLHPRCSWGTVQHHGLLMQAQHPSWWRCPQDLQGDTCWAAALCVLQRTPPAQALLSQQAPQVLQEARVLHQPPPLQLVLHS
jgi:hypothetical protein